MANITGKTLTSKEAARALGVSEASVKRWADSGLLPTARTAGGHRRFRPEDVALFKHRRSGDERPRLIKGEMTAPAASQLSETEATGLVSEEALVEETFHALMDGRAEDVSALMVNLYLRGQRISVIADSILCPPLRRIGDLWHKGELTVAQEHVATRTSLSALLNLQAVMYMAEERALVALCCSVEEDFHELPVQLAALTLEANGYEVFNMGTSTPFFALTEAVERFRPEVICVASTLLKSLDRAVQEYAEFHAAARRAHARVVLGGQGFADAEVRRRLPADLYAESFQQLEDFINALRRNVAGRIKEEG